jgi:GNAT superfamily N-acetyltransferase
MPSQAIYLARAPMVNLDCMSNQEVIRVRRYQPTDREAVLGLAPRLADDVAPWRERQAVLAAVCGWVQNSADTAAEADRAVFVADVDGRVAGLVSVSERTHFTGQVDGYVGELVVAADSERLGIGTSLMAAAEAWAAGRGRAFLTLETGAASQRARSFYAALGYQEEDIRLTKPLLPGTAP